VDAWSALQPDADRIRRGNVMARARMILLYDLSQRERRLVLGTGNRSEWLLGYTTLYGDNACAFNPVGAFYKTEIRLLAAHLGLPEAVLRKAPSADLWAGQSDEDELGFSYAEADRLLHHMVDEGLGDRQLAALGFPPELVTPVRERVRGAAFKRRWPPVLEVPGRRHPEEPGA
jgi:NAD+ synthase